MTRKPRKDPRDVRTDTFAMRLNSQERRMLVALAESFQRSQSGVVRLLIREATRQLRGQGLLPPATPAGPTQEVPGDQP